MVLKRVLVKRGTENGTERKCDISMGNISVVFSISFLYAFAKQFDN